MKGGLRIAVLLMLVALVCVVISATSCAGPTPEIAQDGPPVTKVYYEWQKIDGPGDCESYILYFYDEKRREYSTGCIAMWCNGVPTLTCP